jgi:peptidoglycan/xylan/chitin deacetylase (PgdA/CDA1 family)
MEIHFESFPWKDIMNSFIRVLKKSVYKVASWEPLLTYWRMHKLQKGIVVLMYHELAEDYDDIESWTVVKKSDFIKQVNFLSEKFNIISLDEAFQKIRTINGEPKPAAVITFDDGDVGNKKILLPLVTSMNIPVSIFVSTKAVQDQQIYWYDRVIFALRGNSVKIVDLRDVSLGTYCINKYKGQRNWAEIERLLADLKTLQPSQREMVVKKIELEHGSSDSVPYRLRPLTIDDVRELAECPLITIGAHSHCHNILTQLDTAEIRESIRTSRELLEEWTGRSIRLFSYPNGDYNTAIIDQLKSLGFSGSLTTVPRLWEKDESFFTVPRIGIGRYDSFDLFKIKVSGGLV